MAGFDRAIATNLAPLITRVGRSSTFAVTSTTNVALEWNTEDEDDGGWHDNSTNPERITVTDAGLHIVGAGADFGNSLGTGNRFRLSINHSVDGIVADFDSESHGTSDVHQVHTVHRAAAGTYYTVQVFHTKGSDATLGTDGGSHFYVARIGS